MISRKSATLVVGIGSPHGDDQAGWRVVDRLQSTCDDICQLRQAKVPHELLDHLGSIKTLHAVDCCAASATVAAPNDDTMVSRYELLPRRENDDLDDVDVEWIDDHQRRVTFLPALNCDTSHHIDLVTVFQLARALRTLPSRVIVWTIAGRNFAPQGKIDAMCEQRIERCATRIESELKAN